MLYKAFISYSHQADGKRAAALHSALHRFTRPWYKLRALRVFRDQVNLSATPNLWSTIQGALENSEYFILLASTRGASSKWVAKEIEHWCAKKDANKILIVSTEGKIVWGDSDFDWQQTTALPKSLTGKFANEPLWIDLSWVVADEEMSLRHLKFREAVATLAAPLHGRSKEELDSEDVRESRRTKLLARGAITALTILILGVGALAYLSYYQYSIGIERRRVSLSRQLSVQSSFSLDRQLDLALLLSVAAYRTDATAEAKSSLLNALLRSPSLIVFLRGHKEPVNNVTFSSDGSKLASGGSDGTIILWDANTNRQLATLSKHVGGVNVIAFSPDDRLLASGSDDQTFIIWDVEKRTPLFERSLEQPPAPVRANASEVENAESNHPVGAIAFSHDGKKLAVYAGESNVSLWDVATGTRSGEYKIIALDKKGTDLGSLGLDKISFIGESERLAAYTSLGALLLWDMPGKSPQVYPLYDPMGGQGTGTFSHDGQTLAVKKDDGNLDLWALVPKPVKPKTIKVDLQGAVLAKAFSWDGKLMALGVDRERSGMWEIRIINLETGQQVGQTLLGHRRDVYSVAFSRNGTRLASGGYDRTVILWNLADRFSLGELLPNGEPLAKENPRNHHVSVALSPDGKRIAGANASGTVIEWDSASRQPLNEPLKGNSKWTAINYTPGNVLRRISSDYKTVTVQEGESSRSFELPFQATTREGSDELFLRLAASADGRVLAAQAPDGTIRLWELKTFKSWGKSITGQKVLWFLTLSADGSRLAAYNGLEKTVIQWSTATGEQNGRISLGESDLGSMTFSFDGTQLAMGTKDDRALIFNISDGTQHQWFLTGDQKTSARSIAFSPDGKNLAIGTLTGGIIFFDVANGPSLGRSKLVTLDTVHDVAFDREGKKLVSATYSGQIVLWDLDVNSWIERALRKANRPLTPEEQRQYVNLP